MPPKETGDWEKLEAWMGVIWRDNKTSELMEDVEWALAATISSPDVPRHI